MNFSELALAQHEQLIAWRRHFRQHPELSGQERATQQYVFEALQGMGLEPRKVAGTGVVAEIVGSRPGKRVALRADMDALAVQDELDKPYRSQQAGVSHACGHDAHMAILLATAKALVTVRALLAGTVRLLFQPSEECFPSGAQALLTAGALVGVDSILGLHVWRDVPAGKASVLPGPMMAAPDEFILLVQGRGGHGSMPHQTVDPIWTGAQIVNALKSITASLVNPAAQSVVSVGLFKAGEVFNVIPDTALIKGTVRTFDEGLRTEIHGHIERICRGICQTMGAGCQLEIIKGFAPVINDAVVAEVVAEAVEQALGETGLYDMQPVMGGEDFSCYLEHIPGAFFFLGIGNEQSDIVYPHHHPRFDVDETILSKGAEIMLRAAWRLTQD